MRPFPWLGHSFGGEAIRIVDRKQEMSRIDDALRGPRSGRGTTIAIEGPAGIGKTTLLAAACERASEQGTVALTGRGYELDQETLGVALAMLRPLADTEEGPGVERLRELVAADGAAPSGDSFAVVESLFQLCAAAAERGPMLLAMDDIQWVDPGTRSLIRRLAREIRELPICLLVAYRTGEPYTDAARQTFSTGSAPERIAPGPLSLRGSTEIVRDQLGAAAPAELCRACAEGSGGNPLLLGELLNALRESGLGAAATTEDVRGLSTYAAGDLARARLDRCSAWSRRVALSLAVLGTAEDPTLVAAAAEVGIDELEEALRELRELELSSELELSLRHPLLGRAVFEAAGEEEVARARLAAARALAGHGYYARAGAQLLGPGAPSRLEGDWVVSSLVAAASEAGRRGDREEATRFLGHALDSADSDDWSRRVLLERGRILALNRDPASIPDLAAALNGSADPRTRGEIALRLGQACFFLVRLEEAARVCRDAAAELGEADRELRLMLEAEALNADRLRGAGQKRARNLLPEVSEGSTPGERAALLHVAAEAVATGSMRCDEVAELARLAWGEGAMISELGADTPLLSFLGTTLAWCEAFDEALELAEDQLNAGRRRHAPVTVSYALALKAGVCIRVGDLAQAEADAEQVVSELPASDPLAQMIAFGWMLEALVARGRIEEARRRLGASGLTGELPDLGTADFLMLSRGDTRLATGDPERALADYYEAGRRAERSEYRNPAGYAWRSRAAMALLELGDGEAARELTAVELKRARDFGAPRALGIALRAHGLAAPDDRRRELLEEAVETLEGSAGRLELARANHDLGWTSIREGDPGAAEGPLERAMDGAHSCGAAPLVSGAMEGLRACGRRPRRPAIRGADALTAQQLRVARLAADGLANPEIAEALFLTRRTVELHLTGAYRKLEIDTREELAETLSVPT